MASGRFTVRLNQIEMKDINLNGNMTATPPSRGASDWFVYRPEERQYIQFNSINSVAGTYGRIYDENMNAIEDRSGSNDIAINRMLEKDKTYYYSIKYYTSDITNDTTVRFNRLNVKEIEENQDIPVTIDNEENSEWYIYTPTKTQPFAFSSRSDIGNTSGIIYDAGLYALVSQNGNPEFHIEYILRANQTYLFSTKFINTDQTGNYSIKLEPKKANPISPDSDIAVDITKGGEHGWLSYTPTETEWYNFYSYSAGSNVALYDQNFNGLPYDYNYSAEAGVFISYKLYANKTYYFSAGYSSSSIKGTINAKLCKLDSTLLEMDKEMNAVIEERGMVALFIYTPTETEWARFTSDSQTDISYSQYYNYKDEDYIHSLDNRNTNDLKLYADRTYYFLLKYKDTSKTGTINFKLSEYIPTQINVGEKKPVSIEKKKENVWFSYTAAETGWVRLSSDSSDKVSCEIYNGNYYYHDYNYYDYYNQSTIYGTKQGNPNFSLAFYVTEGSTYYFPVRYQEENIGNFNIQLQKSLPEGNLENKYLQYNIHNRGSYSLGILKGDEENPYDDNKNMLYNHPNGTSSQTLLSVNGSTFFFHAEDSEIDGKQAIAVENYGDVEVKQTLSFAPNPLTGGREDIAYISYEMINHGSEIASLGGRILLDTMIGSNDGAPFQVNGNQVTVETEYSGDDVPQYWECFDKYVEPDMYANGTFYTDMYAIPDRVQFLGWSNLYNNNTFSYNVNNESYSDSSVAVYFNEQKIAPGQKRTFQTYYGIGKPAAVAENDDVVLSVTAPTSLRDNKKFEGRYDMNPFKITAYVQNKTSETMENVEIELNLPDTGELELEDGYVSLIKDIKIEPGSSANCSWDVFAFSQEEAIDIGYAVKLNYSPEKSLDLPLSINLGKVDPLVPRVVTYNLNYKGAETYTQEVENGFRLTKPEDPVREGYLFKGWYANKECSGDIDWFNQFAGVLSQKRILQNTTLYAKWEGLGSITQEDVFNFSSENEEFKKSITKLRPNYLKILKDALSSAEYELIEDKNKTIDHNRSFGMAAIIVLMKLGHLNPENYQDAATEINQLNLSQKNKQVAQIIEYYTLLQYLSYVNNTMLDFGKLNNEEKNAKTLAMFQTTNIPLVVSVASKSNEDELHMAVFKDENGLLQAWNPLAMEFQTLTLENGTCTLSGTEYNLTAVFDFTDDYFASKNPEEYSRNGGKQKDKAVKRQTKETATAAYLFTSHDTFTATHSNGETAKVTADGINGPLAISFLAKLSDSEYLYTVPILTGAETLSIEMPDEEWKLSYIYHDSQDGSLQSAAANLGGEAVIGSKGELVTILPQTAEQTLSSTLNQVDTAWNTVTVYGNSIGLSIKNSAQLGNIYNASTEKVTLELSNSYNILALPDLTIPQQGATISQEQGVDNQLYAVVRDPDGNELARQENTYSLSFYTMNASTVDTQSGLKSGEKAVRPADPVLAGFNFNGWITKGQTKWNFNQDVISGDTVLYATWIENRDLLHQITFRAEGNDDMIYRLLDGSSIAAEDMPAIPKRRGYTGIWDVDEIVSADRDVIVRAVYTRDYSVSGFVVSVEHGKGGTVNPAGEDLYENKLLAIQMTPEEGYFIGDVLVNGLSALKDVANNQLTLTLDRDYKVIVSFKRNIESASFSTIPNEIYTGTAIQPAFTLAYNREPLVLNTDYTVTYENNKNAGTADVIVTGIGTYGGNAVSHFTIEPKSITMEGVVAINRAYDGSNYVVLEGGKLVGLAEGDNVAFSLGSGYMTDAKVGNGKQVITDITLKGASKGNYSLIQPDDIKVDISAAAATVESVKITPDNVEGRRGEKIQFEATVEGKNDPSQDVKWNVSGNNSAATKINASGLLTIAGGETAQELIITAISELDQTKSGEAVVRLIEEQNLASASIMPIPDQVYTRSALEPEFTLSYEGNILQPGTDYSATYWNNTNAGTADILIIGKGAYTGTIIAHFTIKPKLIHISGVRAVDRTYDGKNRVTLEGGSLSGVIEGDNNAFSLGYGYMADAKAGNEKKVTTNIVLVGSLKNNYRLIQPDLKVNIYAKPSVSSVKITTKIASIGRGDKQPFAVKVEGLNNPSQKITWKLSGNKSKSTKINSSGLLTVSAREKAKKLTITAVSKLNTEKKT
jgi:hypothetical protein